MAKCVWVSAVAVLLQACAVTADPDAVAEREPPPPELHPCIEFFRGSHYLAIRPVPVRQGATLTVTPQRIDGPFGTDDVPFACTSDWTVSDPSVRLSADHTQLVVAPDAPPGRTVEVSARVGDQVSRASFRVLGRDEVSLAGTWSEQPSPDCHDANDPGLVRELVFGDNGSFSVTFMPFERYSDYWGAYSFNPATGAMKMTMEKGNHMPADVDLEGRAELRAPNRLVFSGVSFGTPARGGARPTPCVGVFAKR